MSKTRMPKRMPKMPMRMPRTDQLYNLCTVPRSASVVAARGVRKGAGQGTQGALLRNRVHVVIQEEIDSDSTDNSSDEE